jgi:hypothetical protein
VTFLEKVVCCGIHQVKLASREDKLSTLASLDFRAENKKRGFPTIIS